MPTFNPQLDNNSNNTSTTPVDKYSPDKITTSNSKPTTTHKFNPNPILETVHIGLDQPAVKAYTDLVPRYYKPLNIPIPDELIDVNWTDKPIIAAKYSNGIPIYTAVRLNGVNDKGFEYISGLGELDDIYLDNAILTVKQDKNIIRTYIMGKDYSIKEYIGKEDYDITIEGVLLGSQNGVYPIDATKLLQKYQDLNVSIYVTNPYLNDIFDINYITIKGFVLEQTAGGISQQKFKIQAYNDDLTDSDIVKNVYIG